MFFSDDLLTTKKGSFGVIWLAATLGTRTKRITRKDLTTVDLSKTCELIAEPPEPMALRLSGCLLVGVARVYNQTYEIFYTDVNQFHSAIRRSFATEFSAAGNAGGATAGVDLIGDGKSRFDLITFSGLDVGQELGFNFDSGFDYINWNDPLGKRKRRRNTSKLDSLPSQLEGEEEDSSSEGSGEDETDDGSEIPKRRNKRSKVDSSPLIGQVKDTTLRRTPLYHQADPLADGMDLDFPGDQPIDLGLMDNMGDTSISGPSGRGFELPDNGMVDMDMGFDWGGQNTLIDMPASQTQNDLLQLVNDEATVGEGGQTVHKNGHNPHRSVEPEEKAAAPVAGSKSKKPRKKRTVAVEDDREIDLDEVTDKEYRKLMAKHNSANEEKERSQKITIHAENLVGMGGFRLTAADQDLQDFLHQAFQPAPTRWVLAVQAHREGRNLSPAVQPDELRVDEDMPYIQPDQGDVFGGNAMDFGDMGTYEDFAQGAGALDSLMPRAGSEGSDEPVNRVRKETSRGKMSPLGTEMMASDHGEYFVRSTNAADLPVGFDNSVSARSLRLSIMTPRELRIRKGSGQGSSSQIGRRARSRSASGSILGRNDPNPAMLIGGQDDVDLELPPDDFHLDMTESQADQRPDLPEAFKPEMLAALESSCRDFLSYIEREMLTQSVESLSLDDIVPTTTSKRVGASAFYNCLTLATKRMLSLDQEDAFGPITVRLAS